MMVEERRNSLLFGTCYLKNERQRHHLAIAIGVETIEEFWGEKDFFI